MTEDGVVSTVTQDPQEGPPPQDTAGPSAPSRPRRILEQYGRDMGLILPGFFITLAGFVTLIVLFAVGVGTFVIWIGALLLPLALTLASAFAGLTRARIRIWGRTIPRPHYLEARGGLMGPLRLLADPRRWLDLLFETLIAFPMRTASFALAVAWSASALGGITYWFWGIFLPPGDVNLVELWARAAGAPESTIDLVSAYPMVALGRFLQGLFFLVTAPLVVHALALLEVTVARAALGPQNAAVPPDHRSPDATRRAEAPKPWSARAWGLLVTAIAAIALIAVAWPVHSTIHGIHPAVSMLIAFGLGGGLVLSVVRPTSGLTLGTVSAVVSMMLNDVDLGAPWPWTVPVLIAWLLTVLVASLTGSWRVPVIGVPVGVLSSVFVAQVLGPGVDNAALANIIVASGISIILGVVGGLIGAWLRSRHALADAERLSAAELARRQDLEERNRIARELHDVVAHSMSVISVQATTARFRLPDVDESVAHEFESIADNSRTALSEMRSLLGLLRGSEAAEKAPQPGPDDIHDLVATTRHAGVVVDLDVSENAFSGLPPSTGLTVYRTVQEALSNAVRHSPGSRIDVRASRETHDDHVILRLRVDNGPADPELGATPSAPGAGLGLSGIRERVGALGGHFTAGPREAGGFTVDADIPIT